MARRTPSSQPDPNDQNGQNGPWQGQYPPPPGYAQQGQYPPPPGPGAPQGWGPAPGYPPPGQPAYPAPQKRKGLATAAMVLGIIGFVMAIIPFVNFVAYPVVILAIIFGLLAVRWGKGKAGLILGILGLVATVLWTVGIAGAFDDAINQKHTVVYEVTGTGQITKADIQYFSSDGSNRSSNITADDQSLPFSKSITVKGDFSGFVLSANTPITGSDSLSGNLTCKLLVDGKVVSTDTSSGSVADVTCSGTGYQGK